MADKKPVVVYAASGYTGKLTCEWLAKLKIPFIAAGRNQQKLDEAVAGFAGADCEAVAVPHEVGALTELFRGSKVVVNISGPFSKLGKDVVEASFEAGCHYLDSTGEQDFMLDMRELFDQRFEDRKLVLAPSTAFLWAFGAVAAEVCLETEGIDDLVIVNAPASLQTMASLQSMARTARRDAFNLRERALHPIAIGQVHNFLIPFTQKTRPALEIGAGEATWFLGDTRVRNARTFFANADLARAAGPMKAMKRAEAVLSLERLDKWSDGLIERYKKNPGRERPEDTRFVVYAVGEGNHSRAMCALYGSMSYDVTGWIAAECARRTLEGHVERYGYRSAPQAFGTRAMLRAMEDAGIRADIQVAG
ncbi:MAG: DUF5938 domain-containing protein [Myxococcales bacterium]|nr:DUF5938 domain-containing protein [Myxococcales bacterium]